MVTKLSLFKCMECGKKFRTVQAAERAAFNGCPKCNGGDIEPDYGLFVRKP